MTKWTVCLLILTQLLSYTAKLEAANIYQWKDEKGVIHYSDSSPIDKKFSRISVEAITTTNFSKVKQLPFKRIKQRNHSKAKRSSISLCQKIKNKLTKLELKLSEKNTAAKFDSYNEKLSQLRWQKLKSC